MPRSSRRRASRRSCSPGGSSGTSTRPPAAAESPRCCSRCSPTRAGPGSTCAGSRSSGDPDFFRVTKRIHNHLHGAPTATAARSGERGAQDLRSALLDAADELAELVRDGDIVYLHDPQTAGLVPHVKRAGAASSGAATSASITRTAGARGLGLPAALRRARPTPTCSPARSSPGMASDRSGSGWCRPRSTPSRPRTRRWTRTRSRRSSTVIGLAGRRPLQHRLRARRTAATAGSIAPPSSTRGAAPRGRPADRPGLPLGPAQGPGRRAALLRRALSPTRRRTCCSPAPS